jgi:hypothetical protein
MLRREPELRFTSSVILCLTFPVQGQQNVLSCVALALDPSQQGVVHVDRYIVASEQDANFLRRNISPLKDLQGRELILTEAAEDAEQ